MQNITNTNQTAAVRSEYMGQMLTWFGGKNRPNLVRFPNRPKGDVENQSIEPIYICVPPGSTQVEVGEADSKADVRTQSAPAPPAASMNMTAALIRRSSVIGELGAALQENIEDVAISDLGSLIPGNI